MSDQLTTQSPAIQDDRCTPGPWKWMIEDYSMATLCGPNEMEDLVMAAGPCDSCAEHAHPKTWEWGRCMTPSKVDADILAAAPETAAELTRVKALNAKFENVLRDCADYFDQLSDVDHNGHTFIGNEEMNLLTSVEEVLPKAKGETS